MGHVLMENKNGLAVDTRLTQASGTAEREAALSMMATVPGRHRATLGADKGYDTKNFVKKLRCLRTTPHVAQKKYSAIDGRTPGTLVTKQASAFVNELKRYSAG